MSSTLMIIVILVILVIIIISMYNSLVGKRNKVRNSWSQIDVQLKRRFDLIPNLMETVKGYAAHERGTFEEVTAARTKYMSATSPKEMMQANGEMTQVLGRLMAVSEAYPELKANASFIELQDQLAKTEDKITFARQFYNDVVMMYNNAIQMFPTSFLASVFGFREEPFFNADETEKAAPQIKF
ncbi:MAG: LemA family protein [Clostridiales bacterium]|nr:LemA family protein [Clostridiales bacterium]